MFCPNCGAEVDIGLSDCVYCNESLDELRKLEADDYERQLEGMFPVLSDCKGFTVKFMDREVKYDSKMEQIKIVNTVIDVITEKDCGEFEKCVAAASLASLSSDIIDKGWETLHRAKAAFVAFAKQNTTNDEAKESLENFESCYFAEIAVQTQYAVAEVDDVAAQVEQIRRIQKEERKRNSSGGRWVGGGFGFGGAIRGAINASILNAGTGVVRGVGNVIGNSLQKGIDNININKLKREICAGLCTGMITEFRVCYNQLTDFAREALLPGIDLAAGLKSDRMNDFVNKFKNNRNLTVEECIDEICYLLGKYPCTQEIYPIMYALENGRLGQELSETASHFFDEKIVQKSFVQLDLDVMRKNKASTDDGDDELRRKWMILKKIEENNPAYYNEYFFEDKDAIKFKDNLLRLWIRLFGQDVINEQKKYENIQDFNDLWRLGTSSQPVAFLIYIAYRSIYKDEIANGDMDAFLKKSGDIQGLIKNHDKLAMYIWANIMISITEKQDGDAAKYMKVIEMLADKGYGLAQAYLGECCYLGRGGVKKDIAKAEILLRKALWNYSPVAICYFGEFYAHAECGYKKDITMADEFLKIAEAYRLSSAKKEREKLRE